MKLDALKKMKSSMPESSKPDPMLDAESIDLGLDEEMMAEDMPSSPALEAVSDEELLAELKKRGLGAEPEMEMEELEDSGDSEESYA